MGHLQPTAVDATMITMQTMCLNRQRRTKPTAVRNVIKKQTQLGRNEDVEVGKRKN